MTPARFLNLKASIAVNAKDGGTMDMAVGQELIDHYEARLAEVVAALDSIASEPVTDWDNAPTLRAIIVGMKQEAEAALAKAKEG